MIFDDHDVAYFIVLVQTSSSVGKNHGLHTQKFEYPHRHRNLEQNNNISLRCSEELHIKKKKKNGKNGTQEHVPSI